MIIRFDGNNKIFMGKRPRHKFDNWDCIKGALDRHGYPSHVPTSATKNKTLTFEQRLNIHDKDSEKLHMLFNALFTRFRGANMI